MSNAVAKGPSCVRDTARCHYGEFGELVTRIGP